MKVTVLHNQSILDFAIHHTGEVSNCFAIAVANGIAVSDDLIAGSDLVIPETVKNNRDILNYYTAKQIKPATAITNDNTAYPEQLGGIGYMQIGSNFIVT